MKNIDDFSYQILEEAKRFLEKAEESEANNTTPYLHASLLLSISSLEAFINGIADEFKDASSFSIFEQAFLTERDIILKNGKFQIENRLKMTRLLERIEFLFGKFNYSKLNKTEAWWQHLQEGIDLRNSIVHPKEYNKITIEQIERSLNAVLICLDRLFEAIYKKGLPVINKGLDSKLNF